MYSVCYSCQFLISFDFYRQIFEKKLYTNLNEDPSSGRRVVSCGHSDAVRRTDMTKLMLAFRNFAKATEKYNYDIVN